MTLSRGSTSIFLAAVTLRAVVASSPTGLYRVWFTKTYGGMHTCMTEIAFIGADNETMKAEYQTMSSCYGCQTCEDCNHRYGNPNALFDGKISDNQPDAWACTAPGSFTDGVGQQYVTVKLPSRPKKFALMRAMVDGDWVTKDFSLEEQQDDESWWSLASETDAAVALEQLVNVPAEGGNPLGQPAPPGWEYDAQEAWTLDYPECGGPLQSPIVLNTDDDIPRGALGGHLVYNFEPLQHRALVNTGKGLQVGGSFGTIMLPGDNVYEARQFHFHFPAEHVTSGDHRPEHAEPVGEMQLAFQKRGSKGNDELLMLVIQLRLPLEGDDSSDEQLFFRDLGLLGPYPAVGEHTNPMSHVVDLNVFEKQMKGDFWYYNGAMAAPPCDGNVHWIVLQETARIDGDLLAQLLQNGQNARNVQDRGGREVWINSLPGAPVATAEAAA